MLVIICAIDDGFVGTPGMTSSLPALSSRRLRLLVVHANHANNKLPKSALDEDLADSRFLYRITTSVGGRTMEDLQLIVIKFTNVVYSASV